MRSTFKILFYINRGKVKADGTTSILCRISIDAKQAVLSTGLYCQPDNWNAQKGEIDDERSNNQLIALRQRIEQTYETILKEKRIITAELLKNTILEFNKVPTLLLEAGEAERERLKARSLEINSTSSYRQSKVSQSNLRDYLFTLKKKDIAFTDITQAFGEGYKLHLRGKGYRAGYINHCFTWLNRLIYIAVDREILRFNPIADVPYEKKEPPKLQHISRNELKTIMENPASDKLQELTRRAFIFSAFTALAYVDVKGLYPRHIGKTAEGRCYYGSTERKRILKPSFPCIR